MCIYVKVVRRGNADHHRQANRISAYAITNKRFSGCFWCNEIIILLTKTTNAYRRSIDDTDMPSWDKIKTQRGVDKRVNSERRFIYRRRTFSLIIFFFLCYSPFCWFRHCCGPVSNGVSGGAI